MTLVVPMVVPLVVVMSHQGEVDGEQQAEDQRLHNTGEELDWEEEVTYGNPSATKFIHGDHSFMSAVDVSVEPQAQ